MAHPVRQCAVALNASVLSEEWLSTSVFTYAATV
jgi:hypothetical protein